jgi:hypothetical protein
MTNETKVFRGSSRAVAALCLLLGLNACGLDEVEIPDLEGPSELGLSLKLTASPDIITADGFSSSLIQATVRDNNGNLVAGRAIFMSIADENGFTADIGQLRGGSGLGTGVVVTSGTNGIAQASYEAPVRTDFTAHGSVVITARPVGDDANGQVYRSVRVELRSAEPRFFPQVPGDDIRCNFTVEPGAGPYKVNSVISFMSAAASPNGPIVRYEWFFGDGTSNNHPQEAKVYHFPGTYQVVHVVTDSLGFQAACSTLNPIVVIP